MKNSRLALFALCLLIAPPASARSDLCEVVIADASRATGVPASVLMAITLTETGRMQGGRLRPWPWAAQAGGTGHWFATRAEVLDFARRLLAQGRTSFDLGCFQINWRWHGGAFTGPEDLLDPALAAGYAARLLADLHAELGTWEAAAGAYHSRTPERAAIYRARFARILAALDTTPPAPVATAGAPFPLLTGSSAGASLVPVALPRARPLFERRP